MSFTINIIRIQVGNKIHIFIYYEGIFNIMIKVIETSSEDRQKELEELFEKMRPYLENGFSYSRAYKIITGLKHSAFAKRRWWKDLLEYGEKQGYPKRFSGYKGFHTGLYSVSLHRDTTVKGNFIWRYYYTNQLGYREYFADTDLKKLRKIVEDADFTWKVVDLEFAQQSYYFNNIMKRPRKKYQSGVANVHHLNDESVAQGYRWRYLNGPNGKTLYSTRLIDLYKKATDHGFLWNIYDKDAYEEWLRKEAKNE